MRGLASKPASAEQSNSPFRSYGSRKSAVQTKLQVNKPGDAHEMEADQAAEKVVNQPKDADTIARKPISHSITPLQRKEEDAQLKEEDTVQAKEDVQQKEELQKKESPQFKNDISWNNTHQKKEDSVQRKEDVQMKESEIAPMGMPSSAGEKDPIRAAVQRKEDVQMKEAEIAPMGMPSSAGEKDPIRAAVQRKEEVQAKEEESVQAKENKTQSAGPVASEPIDQKLSSSKGTGTPLSADVQSEMESGFGADFSSVQVHTGSQAQTMSKEIGAQAFTHKNDIYFNQGKYDPNSTEGKKLLAHELTHTIQQGAAPVKNHEEKDNKEAKTDDKTTVSETKQEPETSDAPTVSVETPQKAVQPDSTSNTTASPLSEATEIKEDAENEGETELQSPENDPEFQQTLDYIGQTAQKESQHPNAKKKVKQVKQAAVLPTSKQERANDEAVHIAEMEATAKKRKPFQASSFKNLLKKNLTDLEKQLPKDKKSADKFKEKKPIDKVKQNIGNQVESENAKISGPLASKAGSEKPPRSGGHVEREKPINKDESGKSPKPFDPKSVLPKKKKDSAISMEKESASMDDFMAKNNMSDEQLAKSEEPKFIAALESKKAAQKKTAEVPQEFRKKEDEQLKGSEKTVSKENKKAFDQMHKSRSGTFANVFGKQKSTEKTDEEKKAEMNDRFNKIYTQTQQSVTSKLDWLSDKVTAILEHDAEKAKRTFEKNVEAGLDDIYGLTTLDDKLFGEDIGAINRLFKKEKAIFISAMDDAIDKISMIIAKTLNEALAIVERGRQKAKDYFEGLDKSWQKLGQEAYDLFSDKYNDLEDSVHETENQLAKSLAQIYKDNVDSLDETFNELKEAASTGWLDGAWEMLKGIAETIQTLIDAVTNLLSSIKSALPVIIADPIGFMKQLFSGIKLGIDNFKSNIQTHLMGGLLTWLTGALGPIGITLPDDIFSLKGIFSLVMQVLGLGWDTIRLKAVKMMGEPMVNALINGFDMFKLFASEGVIGIWEYLKDQFSDLKETVIDAIKGMLITKVIEAGIKWLFSLLVPGAGFIKAVMVIKDLIVFFVQSAVMLIPAITEAILALAAGSVAGVAMAIEKGLTALIALIINLFAKLIGLGDLSKKVMDIFAKVRNRVDKAVMKLLKKAQKAGRKLMAKLGIGAKEKPKNKQQHDEQVQVGLQYIDKLSNQEDKDKDGNINEETAYDIAKKTKQKFKVFTDITPRLEGDTWVYDWKGSSGTKKTKKKNYPYSPEIKKLIKDLKGLPGAQSLVGYLKSKKIMPWFKHGFKTQAERALHYKQIGLLIDIEHRFEDKSKTPAVVSRFDLVVKDVDSNGKDTGGKVVVEVKNWTGFENLNEEKQEERLTMLERQLLKYKASGNKVLLEWKGSIPKSVSLLCKQMGITVNSI